MSNISIIYFTKQGCGPCNLLKPVMDKLAATVPITRIDVELAPRDVAAYNVVSVPTILYLRNGQVVHRQAGHRGRELILATIRSLSAQDNI